MAPYRGLWPESAIAAFREEMAATLATHPAAMRLLREARPASLTVEPSGEVRITGVVQPTAPLAGNPAAGKGAAPPRTGTK